MYHRDACISVFIATLFTIVKLEKITWYSTTEEMIKKMELPKCINQ